MKIDKFIEDHIVMDELDGVERTMVEFNFNEWIRFKRGNIEQEEEIAPINSEKGIEQRDKIRDRLLKGADEEERLKNSVQRIKPIIIDTKILKKSRKKRFPKDWKKLMSGKTKGNRGRRFPKELVGFVKERVDELNNPDLCEEINKEFDLKMGSQNLSKWMYSKGIKRIKGVRTPKAEMIADGEHVKKKGVLDMRTKGKYPKEMKEFIRSRMETTSNQNLTDLINEEFDLEITMDQVKNYMKYNKLRREKRIRSPRISKEEIEKKKIEKPKKWTDEAVQFLRDNINNFSNKQLCEELDSQFNIKTNVENLAGVLSQKGIRRDQLAIQSDVDQGIRDFIAQSKIKDALEMRDKIIEKFEINLPVTKLKNLMDQRKEKLPGEGVKDEVKRIKETRGVFEGDDEMDFLDED